MASSFPDGQTSVECPFPLQVAQTWPGHREFQRPRFCQSLQYFLDTFPSGFSVAAALPPFALVTSAATEAEYVACGDAMKEAPFVCVRFWSSCGRI